MDQGGAEFSVGKGGVRPPFHEHLKALGMVERALGKDHPNVALTLLVIGDACASSGDYQDARSYYERALLIRTKHFTDSSQELVECKKRIQECRAKKKEEGRGECVVLPRGCGTRSRVLSRAKPRRWSGQVGVESQRGEV